MTTPLTGQYSKEKKILYVFNVAQKLPFASYKSSLSYAPKLGIYVIPKKFTTAGVSKTKAQGLNVHVFVNYPKLPK